MGLGDRVQTGASMTLDAWKLNTAQTVAVSDAGVYWQLIDANTPRGVKVQAINRHQCGIAQYAEIRNNEIWYTHWCPLPKFREDQKT